MSDPTSQEPSMAEILLSEDLKYWRVECPDEWIMDRFIKKAKSLESETASLRAQLAETREIIASQCFNVGHSMYPVYKLSNRDCGGSSEWGENKCSRCGKSETWQYDF